MLPLYGDYADGFWDKSIEETAGNYYKAFNFKAFRSSTAIGTDMLGVQKETVTSGDGNYPYFTCELGGGMATAYHRRPFIYPEDTYSVALVKLGSGSNLLGYYMYHGGTNPESTTGITLNETQRTPGTANNDLPVRNYDFQCPLGEFGQTNESYYRLRPLHLFMHDWAETLAPMDATLPMPQDLKKGEDTGLRWAYRSRGDSGFVFINNYERLQRLSDKRNVRLRVCGVDLPRITIPSGTMAIFPVNIDGIRYATAQLVAKRGGRMYMMQIAGIPTTIALQDGRVLKNVKPRGMEKPVCDNIYLLSRQEAEHLFLPEKAHTDESVIVACTKLKEAGPQRQIVKGRAKVAEAPSESDWQQAAVYCIDLPQTFLDRIQTLKSQSSSHFSPLLTIDYRGDCARLYANGKLVADHFQYGRPFLFGLWRLPEDCTRLELRIMPWQADAPIYLPREADKTPGECVKRLEVVY
jgi:hypothetical protein